MSQTSLQPRAAASLLAPLLVRRDTLGRKAEQAYAGEPIDYVSSTPPLLRALRLASLASVTIWAACFLLMLASIEKTTKTIGQDALPSIVDAEHVRSLLADANAEFANVLLVGDTDDGPYMSAFREDIRDAETSLAHAAQNITYGAEETGPIVTMMRGIAEYEHLVGQARGMAASSGRKVAPEDAKEADTLMHFTILPAAVELDRVNFHYLTETYDEHRATAAARLTTIGLVSLVCLAVLFAVQLWLFTRTKRLLNPGLVVATLAVAVISIWSLHTATAAEEQIRVAKADAFDSIFALTTAQSIAYDANAAESFWLLAHGDAKAQDKFGKSFLARAARLAAKPVRDAETDVAAGRTFGGLLGDEFANITFAGERAAADATLTAWGRYLDIDARIRGLETAGRTAEAVALDVGSQEGQSNWAFARFNRALERVTKINETAFGVAITAAESSVNRVSESLVLGAWVLACLGIWFGIAWRLREYEY